MAPALPAADVLKVGHSTAVDVVEGSGDRIITIDSGYPGPMSPYLLVRGEGRHTRAAFVDVNTSRAVPRLLGALEDAGVSPAQVELVVLTHCHLDHSGGTAELLKYLPEAKVLAHPRAAPHIVDPTRLVGAVRQVYGDERFDALYGSIERVDPSRVLAVGDGDRVTLGDGALSFMHTRGHANHHMVVLDEASGSLFSGDAFGIAYPAASIEGRDELTNHAAGPRVLFPATAPADYNTEEAFTSIDKIAGAADRVYLAHYGSWDDVGAGAETLRRGYSAMQGIVDSAVGLLQSAPGADYAQLSEFCACGVDGFLRAELERLGLPVMPSMTQTPLLSESAALNGQGLAVEAMKTAKAAASAGAA